MVYTLSDVDCIVVSALAFSVLAVVLPSDVKYLCLHLAKRI